MSAPIWVTVSVREALESYGGCKAGWWYGEDWRASRLEMHGRTVAQAIAEECARACSDEADRQAIEAGTIEVVVGWSHPHYATLKALLDAQTCTIVDAALADCIAVDKARA